ncbi:AAA family ATPase [Nonomuraea sp. NPDC048826]|uniref:AAA family ATPase n=1 Tax=Nonomuraea sp. NPDC048826 TaxID=3364347 RepID=UPI003710009A
MLGREKETALLDAMLESAVEGHGTGFVVHGEPGIGKTALLSYAVERAEGFRVLRAVGVEPEAELAYATLHQLLLPVLGLVGELPGPQARALRILFGQDHGEPPDPFLVGLSTLSLLSLAAGKSPVLCVLDDAHWADQPTLKTLAFVARRLDDEPIVLALAARADEGHGTDLPHLRRVPLMGLDPEAAGALLGARPLTDGERARLLALTCGNPLALIELAGADLPPEATQEPPAMTDELRRSFLGRIRARHAASLPLLQLIAADGSGSLKTVEKAAASLRIATGPLSLAGLDDLLTYDGARLVFRHPLVRSAIYHSATADWRAAVHRALAAAFDDPADQHRRAWHLGQAATGHDEEAAGQLERSAEQAALRGGPAAAMAALSKAAELTADGPRRGRLLWTAARAAIRGGFTATAVDLIDRAEREPHLEEADRISLAALRAVATGFAGSPDDAMDLVRPWIPRALRIDRAGFAPTVAMYGDLGVRTNQPEAWADLARWLDETEPADDTPQDAVLRLLRAAARARTGRDPGLPVRGADTVAELTDPVTMTLAGAIARGLGDHELSRRLYRDAARLARNSGALGALAWNLEYQAADELARGRFGLAEAHAEEGCQFAAELGQLNTACRHRGLLAWCAALRGRPEAAELAAGVLAEASDRKLADAMACARRALGLLDLVAGRHAEAARHFEAVGGGAADLAMETVPDLVEALVRAGDHDAAAEAAARYARWTAYTSEPTPRALAARCLALVSADPAEHYAESLRLHALADSPLERARTELLFGEQLRRDRRRSEAQGHLRGAVEDFRRIGALAWADRALGELRATGESARTRAPEPGALTALTPQELRITLAVGEGLTNREIAAQLFLSPRTVEYHLRKVFQKAAITSRAELMRLVLAEAPVLTGDRRLP